MHSRTSAEKKFDSRRLLAPAVHVLFILLIFILPEALMRMGFPERPIPPVIYAKTGVMLAVFYLNFFLIIPRTLMRGHRWWQFLGWNVILTVAAIWLTYWLSLQGWKGRAPGELDRWHTLIMNASRISRDAASMLLTLSLAVVLRLSTRWLELERRQQQLIASRRQSELENLRSQLNPHFLFNTLNSIYALIAINPEEAQKVVHDLSGLLRYVVYENPDNVPLEREVEFVKNYVELMRMRMGERPVELNIDIDSARGAVIPPLVLVTLVENAFKHGSTSNPTYHISIEITAKDGQLLCTTHNHYTTQGSRNGSSGVGLANLRRRLELIYGTRARLRLELNDATGECNARLTLPLLPENHES